ncbi:MAG: magnesium transporter CorA family protein [Saprospiraceae bacterium]|nr:magnesium transporter CorA family protein [Saprospiraceae bacterium]
MIRYYIKEDGQLIELDARRPGCWINVSPPVVNTELAELAEYLQVPLDFLTDSLDIDERSRYEREEEGRLILVNTPILNEIDKESEAIYITSPIGIILTEDHVTTISGVDNPIIQKFLEGRVRYFHPDDEQLFVLQIFEQNVVRFLECIKKLNLKRNLIEQELYNSSRNSELKHLLRIEKSLVYFVNSLSANELLKMKMKRTDFLRIRDDEEKADLFEDIIIDNSQALEMSNVYTNILSGTMEAYASIISNNLNVFIQRLTIVTIVLMVPTLVASFYGMNVKLPFEEAGGAFYLILVISVLGSLGLVWFFRRKKLF